MPTACYHTILIIGIPRRPPVKCHSFFLHRAFRTPPASVLLGFSLRRKMDAFACVVILAFEEEILGQGCAV